MSAHAHERNFANLQAGCSLPDETFGAKLLKLREAKGWTRSSMARRLRVSATAIANWEENKATPRDETKAKLTRLFDSDENLMPIGRFVSVADKGLIGLKLQDILKDASIQCAELLGMDPEDFSLSLKIEMRRT